MWLIISLNGAVGVLRGEVPDNLLHPGRDECQYRAPPLGHPRPPPPLLPDTGKPLFCPDSTFRAPSQLCFDFLRPLRAHVGLSAPLYVPQYRAPPLGHPRPSAPLLSDAGKPLVSPDSTFCAPCPPIFDCMRPFSAHIRLSASLDCPDSTFCAPCLPRFDFSRPWSAQIRLSEDSADVGALVWHWSHWPGRHVPAASAPGHTETVTGAPRP